MNIVLTKRNVIMYNLLSLYHTIEAKARLRLIWRKISQSMSFIL